MIDWPERFLCILISFGILGNALVVRRMVQAWAFPAVLFSLAWFIYTIVPLVCFPAAHVYPAAMMYLFGGTIVVSAASLSNWRAHFAESAQLKAAYKDYYGGPLLLTIFAVGAVLSVVCMLLNSVAQGISLSQLVNNVNDSAAEYAGRRYAYDIAPNPYQQVATVLAYFCAGLGGLIMTSQKGRYTRWAITIGSLFPSLFVMLTQSAKGMLFLCGAIFFGGILAERIQRNRTDILSKRAIPAILVGLTVTILLVTASFISRGLSGSVGGDLVDVLAPYWASYTSGHLFAFSDWFANYVGLPAAQPYDDPGLTKGFYTFMPLFRIFGDDRPVPLGTYGEYLSIPPYITTNIYSMYRGMMQDFGLGGSLICLGILSFFAHLSFRAMLKTANPSFSTAAFLYAVAFIYQSFVISSLTWNTLPISMFLIGASLFIMRIRISNQAK